jgi:hypothetical protein
MSDLFIKNQLNRIRNETTQDSNQASQVSISNFNKETEY